MGAVSEQTKTIMQALGAFGEFGTDQALWEALRRPEACDFMFGNPHDVAPQAYVDALVRAAQPTGKDHYAYTMDLPEAVASIGADLRGRFPVAFRDEDIHLTNGNFVGLAIALRTLVDPGDEVIFVSPPWFFYETLIVAAGATPVRVLADRAHGLRPGSRGDRGGDHAADARDHRELPAQPVGQDLHAGPAHGARRDPRRGVEALGSPHLPALRRGLQPDRLRAAHVHDAGRVLPALLPLVHVREDAARARVAARLPRRGARHRGRRRPARCPADRADHAGMGLSGVAAAARDPRAQRDGARHAHPAAPTRHAGRRRSANRATRSSSRRAPSTSSSARRSRTTGASPRPCSRTTCSCCPARCSRCPGGSASR